MYVETGKNADPEFRRKRAQLASAAASSPETHAKRLAAQWPPLTEERRAAIVAILSPLVASTDGGQQTDV